MGRIIVITCFINENDPWKRKLVASHGVDEDTGRSVCLPSESPSSLGATFDPEVGEWVLPEIQRR